MRRTVGLGLRSVCGARRSTTSYRSLHTSRSSYCSEQCTFEKPQMPWKPPPPAPALEAGSEMAPVHAGFMHVKLNGMFSGVEKNNPSIKWHPFLPGIDSQPLYRQGENGSEGSATLLKFQPGAKVPKHWHPSAEHVFCLEGEFSDERGSYKAGDLMFNLAGSQHVGVKSDTGCIVLMIWGGSGPKFLK